MFIYLEWGIFPSTYGHTKKYRTAQSRQTKAMFLGPGHFPNSRFYTFIPAEDLFPWLRGWRFKGCWSHCLCGEKIEQGAPKKPFSHLSWNEATKGPVWSKFKLTSSKGQKISLSKFRKGKGERMIPPKTAVDQCWAVYGGEALVILPEKTFLAPPRLNPHPPR